VREEKGKRRRLIGVIGEIAVRREFLSLAYERLLTGSTSGKRGDTKEDVIGREELWWMCRMKMLAR